MAAAEMPGRRVRVLYLCTHNSACSQIAEGLLRRLAGNRFEVFSAGIEATHVRSLAVRAMDELGIDIAGQQSKTLDRYIGSSRVLGVLSGLRRWLLTSCKVWGISLKGYLIEGHTQREYDR
jgi:hypothetical protein